MLTQIIESILSKLADSILSKVVEQTTDNAHDNVKSIKDFMINLKQLEKNLRLLSAKASDVEEEIKNAELLSRKKRKREVEEWLGEVKCVEKEVLELGARVECEGFIMRLIDGGTTIKFNDEVVKLIEQSRNFGELVLDVCGRKGEIFLTNGMVGDAFKENLETTLELLETSEVTSIGVYGMGGVGKTTLVKHIHNRLLQQSQGSVFWVTVSQDFTLTSLQDKIARYIGVDLVDGDNEDIRAARLHRALSQMKNSILIFDDVWENINMLKVGVSVECCRFIITTRSLAVCRQMHCQKVLHVKKLHKDEAWKLFNETLGNEIEIDRQVEAIAYSVAKMCDGLPLGIITLAGSMRGETSIHSWTNTLAELRECMLGQDGMVEDDVFKVLKYSFDQLNKKHQSEFNTLQLCFLYCSLYPEDYMIHREKLVRKFISEGLLDGRNRRRAQVHQGYSLLDKLVNVCLLESCVNFDDDECVKMHDLARGMALKINEGKYMVRGGDYSFKEISDEQEWTKGLEKVSFINSGITRIPEGISPKCPILSTLLLFGNPLEVIPSSFFSKMHGLCTLDLRGTNITMLPDSISDRKSLKALLLEKCEKLEYVPYLGKLKALRELDLSDTAIKEVPQGLEELFNLNLLSMDAPQLEMLPRGLLLKLGHLQYINFPLHIQVPMEDIENMKQLEEFRGGLENVNDFNRFIRSRVLDTCYRIGVRTQYTSGEGGFGLYNNELILCECNLKDEKLLGKSIVYLTVKECEGLSICLLDHFISVPTSLKKVSIESCEGIECILSNERRLPSQILSNLEYIELDKLEDLKEVIKKGELGASAQPAQAIFPSLRFLRIENCNKMRKLGLPASEVPYLEVITIWECEEIEEIFEDEGRGLVVLPKLKQLNLHGLSRLRKLGLPVLGIPNIKEIVIWKCGEIEEIFEDEEIGPIILSKLKELSLYRLPRVKSICKATMICNSIETLEILKCPRLMKKLPLQLDIPPPPSLREICVERGWWESLEWDNPNRPRLLQPFIHIED